MNSLLYAGSFVMALVGLMSNLSLPLYLTEVKQAGPLIIGLAGFSGSFSYTVTTLFYARVPPHGRRFPWFIYAAGLASLVYLLLGFLPLPLLFAALLLNGFFYGKFWPSIQKSLYSPEGRKQTGYYNLSWSSGVIIGSLVAGNIYSFRPRAPFVLAGTLGLATFTAFFLNRKRITIAFHGAGPELKTAGEKFPAGLVREIRLLSFLNFFLVGAVLYLFPRLALERSIPPGLIGRIVACLLASRFLGFFLLRKTSMVQHPAALLGSCLLLLAGSLLIGLGRNPVLPVLAMVLIGLTGAFSYHNSLLMHLRAGFPMEIHEGIIGGGLFLGPLLAGGLGQVFNLKLAFLLIGTAIFVVGFLAEGRRPGNRWLNIFRKKRFGSPA